MYLNTRRGPGYLRPPGARVIQIPRVIRKRGISGLGKDTVTVNIGPGTTIEMSPADAQAWWGTNVPAPGTGTPSGPYGGYANTGFEVSAASGGGAGSPLGKYSDTALAAYLASPTIQSMIPATPQNLAAPGFTPGAPQYTQTSVSGITGSTTVMTLDSYLQQLLSEMTSRKGQSNAIDIAQQADGYCKLYPGACAGADPNALVQKYTNWFNTWNNETLVPGVDPSRGVVMGWSQGQAPPGVVAWMGPAPTGALPGQTLNYGPGGQAGGLPGVYTPGGYVDPVTGKLLPNQMSVPGGYAGAMGGGGGSGPGPSGGTGSGPQYDANGVLVPGTGGSTGGGSSFGGGSTTPPPTGGGSSAFGGGSQPAGTSPASSSNPLSALSTPVQVGSLSIPAWILALGAGLLFLL